MFTLTKISDLTEANKVYKNLHFEPSKENDETFAFYQKEKLIALGRINFYGEVLEIGGFWVLENERGKGIARELVAKIIEKVPKGKIVYCLPLGHLTDFYKSFGMKEVESFEGLPCAIKTKLKICSESFSHLGKVLFFRS
ncbi:GNAT family N-acetyltransferase [bacterium]|nr:GNAT family N-acetyltransferase [bacterium]